MPLLQGGDQNWVGTGRSTLGTLQVMQQPGWLEWTGKKAPRTHPKLSSTALRQHNRPSQQRSRDRSSRAQMSTCTCQHPQGSWATEQEGAQAGAMEPTSPAQGPGPGHSAVCAFCQEVQKTVSPWNGPFLLLCTPVHFNLLPSPEKRPSRSCRQTERKCYNKVSHHLRDTEDSRRETVPEGLICQGFSAQLLTPQRPV